MRRRRGCSLRAACIAVLVLGMAFASALRATAQQTAPAWQLVFLPMRDGARLATYVLLPSGPGPFPTLLCRTPYPPGIVEPFIPGALFLGYALVVQNERGRFGSGGLGLPFLGDDLAPSEWDGYDTVEWIARQPWSSGKVGVWGASASGVSAYGILAHAPPHLGSAYVASASGNLYRDWVYPGGIWQASLLETWTRLNGFASGALSPWRAHPNADSYWQARDLSARFAVANAPAVHVTGWYDTFLQGTIDAFVTCQESGGPAARGRQRLVIGPWTHTLFQRQAGELLYPDNAIIPPLASLNLWAWLEHTLLGVANGVEREPAVTYYQMGDVTDAAAPGNVWRFADRWPPPSIPFALYLLSNGGLHGALPPFGGTRTYRSDPAVPVPTVGGRHLMLPGGPRDQVTVESRPDVLVFSTVPLPVAFPVAGRVRAELYLSSDAPDTDFIAKLCDVYPDGRSFSVAEGVLRARFRESFSSETLMSPGQIYRLEIDLGSTAVVFNRGHRVRLQVASSCAPAYEVNPQTGAEPGAFFQQVARNRVYCDTAHPSRVILPISP